MRLLLALFVVAASASAAERPSSPWSVPFGFGGAVCSRTTFSAGSTALPDLPSNYYGIEMVPTKRVQGTGNGVGFGKVTFSSSPYGVAVAPSGTYMVDITMALRRIKKPKKGFLIAWATKDDLSETTRLGVLDDDFRVSGKAAWNKFLLVVSLEPTDAPTGKWSGPIVMRGMSRSGMMHTLAGHGPYQAEPCAKYGF